MLASGLHRVAFARKILDKHSEPVILIVIMPTIPTLNQSQLTLPIPAHSPDKRNGFTVVHRPLQSRHATFKGGMEEPVHRWFRLTPSFGPHLVRDVMTEFGIKQDSTVLDPFSGAGTTLIECQLRGIQSFGFEIHPFLHWIASSSLKLDIRHEEAKHQFTALGHLYSDLDASMPQNPENLPLEIPQIHNPYRWWRPDILRDLLVLKIAIKRLQAPSEIKRFFNLGFAGVLVPSLTNVTLGRLQLHFIDRAKDDIKVWSSFQAQITTMLFDLEHTKYHAHKKGQVILIDSTDLSSLDPIPAIDFVITSPPYPNRYSYVWNTRPHLFFFDFFHSAKQSSQLDSKIIGGTWGTATSMLQKGKVEAEFDAVTEFVLPVSEKIRQHDNLMANYIVKYFNGLTRQLVQLEGVLTQGAKLAYVVGCSEIKGVYVETDVILAKIMENLPFECSVLEVRRLRKRNSGHNLYESIVYAQTPII